MVADFKVLRSFPRSRCSRLCRSWQRVPLVQTRDFRCYSPELMPWVWYLRVIHGIRRPELRGRLPPRQVRTGEPSATHNACRAHDLALCAGVRGGRSHKYLVKSVEESEKCSTVLSLCLHCALAVLSLRSHYVLAVRSLCSHCAGTVVSMMSHFALTVRSLCSSMCAHCALTDISLCSHCGLTVLSLCSHCALTVLSLCSHCALTVL